MPCFSVDHNLTVKSTHCATSPSSRPIPVIPVIPVISVIPGFSGHLKLYPFTAGVNRRPMT